MQQDASANAKQLIVERVRQSTNILVAVSANPSVDALAAALGLALMLNKMDKHATAVFSGAMPPAMEFLNPGKTFENSVDSLRDFIISLDKEKADRLRYKVEDDVVRIFITPYRTTISEKDLQFSQGDFNVDLILALGVEKREDLDKAIIAHGRILHDATVMTINANNQQSSLGSVDWHESGVSSLCEMLVSMGEAFQQPGLLDQQIATALLTGIVAATDRFSNAATTPRVMTMAAQLMAAGANQQLIANNLVKSTQVPLTAGPQTGQLLPNGTSVKVAPPEEQQAPKKDGELDIVHPKKEEPKPEPTPAPAPQPQQQQQPQGQGQQKSKKSRNKNRQQNAEEELAAALPTRQPVGFDQLKEALSAEPSPAEAGVPALMREPKAPGSQTVNGASGDEDDEGAPQQEPGFVVGSSSWRGRRLEPPALGGTLNATTERAMDDARQAEENDRNQKLLTHPESAATPQAGGKKMKVQVVEPAPAPSPELKQASEPVPKPAPAPEPKPEPAPAPESPKPSPAPAEPPALEPAPAPEPPAPAAPAPPEPVPMPSPAPEPEPVPAPEPPAPSMPPLPPMPAPQPEPEPAAPAPQPTSAPTLADLEAARRAVDDALQSQPFDPSGQPLQSAGAMPLGVTNELVPAPAPDMTAPQQPSAAPAPEPALPAPEPAAPAMPQSLPPLPPMPPLPQQDPNQPLPPPPSLNDLPPLPSSIPPAPVSPPPEAPAPEVPEAPADPHQFKIPGA